MSAVRIATSCHWLQPPVVLLLIGSAGISLSSFNILQIIGIMGLSITTFSCIVVSNMNFKKVAPMISSWLHLQHEIENTDVDHRTSTYGRLFAHLNQKFMKRRRLRSSDGGLRVLVLRPPQTYFRFHVVITTEPELVFWV